MKLRIHKDGIRIRLVKLDVARLAGEGKIEAHVQLGPSAQSRFCYSLETGTDVKAIDVAFRDGLLVVRMPEEWARELDNTDRIGYTASLSFEEYGVLEVVVEKDFKFRSRRGRTEDEEAYPNPGKDSGRR